MTAPEIDAAKVAGVLDFQSERPNNDAPSAATSSNVAAGSISERGASSQAPRMTDLTEARRLVEAATPGPWDTGSPFEDNYLYAGQTHLACLASSDASDHYLGDDSEAIANARFIVWARNNLPTLLAEHEAALAENERLKAGLDRLALSNPAVTHGWAEAMRRDARALLGAQP
jgi:hypothetical protein